MKVVPWYMVCKKKYFIFITAINYFCTRSVEIKTVFYPISQFLCIHYLSEVTWLWVRSRSYEQIVNRSENTRNWLIIDLLPYVTNDYREIYSHTLNIYESCNLKGCKQELFLTTQHYILIYLRRKQSPMFVLIQTHSSQMREFTNCICMLNR